MNATLLSVLCIVPRHCARLTCFLHPKLREISAVPITPQPIPLRRAGSIPSVLSYSQRGHVAPLSLQITPEPEVAVSSSGWSITRHAPCWALLCLWTCERDANLGIKKKATLESSVRPGNLTVAHRFWGPCRRVPPLHGASSWSVGGTTPEKGLTLEGIASANRYRH